MNYELRALAEADMVEIGRYTAETYSAAQARKYLASLDTLFALLASQPTLGAATELGATLRRMPHHEHIIYYQPRSSGGIVIIRVLHKRMLPSTHL